MKITQLRGDLAAFRNLELSIVLNAMKTENSRKPVTTLRQNIPYLTPGIKSLAAEKIPVVLFGVTLKRDDERIGVATYAGLVLLSIGNLIGYAEAAAIRDRAAGFPQNGRFSRMGARFATGLHDTTVTENLTALIMWNRHGTENPI